MAQKQVGLRLSEALLERIDSRRGDIPRERWIRTQLELATGGVPAHQPGPDVSRLRSSSQAKRDVVPVPKTGKR